MAQYTPGPWTVTREQHDSLGDAPRLFVRAHIGLTKPRIVDLDERDEENARLIAAAPQLLTLLQNLVYNEDQRNGLVSLGPLSTAVRAAIAKAEGR